MATRAAEERERHPAATATPTRERTEEAPLDLSRRDTATLLRLQATAGNAAVTALLRKRAEEDEAREAPAEPQEGGRRVLARMASYLARARRHGALVEPPDAGAELATALHAGLGPGAASAGGTMSDRQTLGGLAAGGSTSTENAARGVDHGVEATAHSATHDAVHVREDAHGSHDGEMTAELGAASGSAGGVTGPEDQHMAVDAGISVEGAEHGGTLEAGTQDASEAEEEAEEVEGE